MTSHLVALCVDAHDPRRLAIFWAGVLGWEPAAAHQDAVDLLPHDDTGFRIRFRPTREPRAGRNQMHLDLTSSSVADQRRTVATALRLGARHLDVGQLPEEEHVVLADPEDNEFCVVEPGNRFLADCGFIGALSCDGSQQLGYFWSRALGWPLVWDQDEETAIRSPHGGPKISWGGPPLTPRPGHSRLRLAVAAASGTDPRAEVDRLVGLGAAVADPDPQTPAGGVTMTDPDGNDFYVLDER